MDAREYERDLQQLAVGYHAAADDDAVRAWLLKHAHYKADVLAQATSMTPHALAKLRRRLGVAPTPRVVGTGGDRGVARRPSSLLVVPETEAEWRNAQWLTNAVATHTLKEIALALRICPQAVHKIMEAHGIRATRNRRVNENFTRDRCYYLYHTLDLSLRDAAKLAGTSLANFSRWLVALKIPLKTEQCASGIRSPLWVRKLVVTLRAEASVKHAEQKPGRVAVSFHGTREHFHYGRGKPTSNKSIEITKESARLVNVPRVHRLRFDRTPGAGDTAQFYLDKREAAAASLMERRVGVYRLIRELTTTEMRFGYSETMVAAAHAAMANHRVVISKHGVDMCRKRCRGARRLLLHYFDLVESERLLRRPLVLARAARALLDRNGAVSSDALIRWHVARFRMVRCPGFCADVLHQLGVSGTLYDQRPAFGSLAWACAHLGIKYLVKPNARFQAAVDRGFAAAIGLNWGEFTGSADWTICDGNLRSGDPEPDAIGRVVSYCRGPTLPDDLKCQAVVPVTMRSPLPFGHYVVW